MSDVVRRPDSVVEAEFRALEREVSQRDCRHPRTVEVRDIGGDVSTICADCGKVDVAEYARDCAELWAGGKLSPGQWLTLP